MKDSFLGKWKMCFPCLWKIKWWFGTKQRIKTSSLMWNQVSQNLKRPWKEKAWIFDMKGLMPKHFCLDQKSNQIEEDSLLWKEAVSNHNSIFRRKLTKCAVSWEKVYIKKWRHWKHSLVTLLTNISKCHFGLNSIVSLLDYTNNYLYFYLCEGSKMIKEY